MVPGKIAYTVESYDKWFFHVRGLLETQQELYAGCRTIKLGVGVVEAAARYEEANRTTSAVAEASTQTTGAITEAPPKTPTRTYAEAATQASPPTGRKSLPATPERTDRASQSAEAKAEAGVTTGGKKGDSCTGSPADNRKPQPEETTDHTSFGHARSSTQVQAGHHAEVDRRK